MQKQYTNAADGQECQFEYTIACAVADSYEFSPRQRVLGSDGNVYNMMDHIANTGKFIYAVSESAVDNGNYVTVTNPDFIVYVNERDNKISKHNSYVVTS